MCICAGCNVCSLNHVQEIDEMLSSTLSLDEEEAVQEELRQLQAETVCLPPAADVFANVS